MPVRPRFRLAVLAACPVLGLTAVAAPAEAASTKPSISAITPTTGPLAGGSKITITGKYFTRGSTVYFGAAKATKVTYSSTKKLYAYSPAVSEPAGVPVSVRTSKGTSKTKTFSYRVAPFITEMSASQGPTTGGNKVTLTGGSFLKDTTSVTFDGVKSSKVTYVSSTAITVTVPKRTAPGDVDVIATNKYGTGPASSYTYVAPPPSTDLAVGSFNVRNNRLSSDSPTNSREKSWRTRLPRVLDQIERSSLDVIGIQEASAGNDTYNKYGRSQFDDMITDLGAPYELTNDIEYCRTPDADGRCADGASSSDRIIYNSDRLQMLDQGSRKLDGLGPTDGKGRYVAWATFADKRTTQSFFFATTHLEPGNAASTRKRQATLILDEIDAQNTGNLPVVLVGDLGAGKFDKYTYGGVTNVAHQTLVDDGFRDPLVNSPKYKGQPDQVASATNSKYSSLNYFATAPQVVAGSYPIGSYLDYILTRGGTVTYKAWETVLDLDSDGDFDGVIPSDHNLITLRLTLG